jgi:hypothetical protein
VAGVQDVEAPVREDDPLPLPAQARKKGGDLSGGDYLIRRVGR